MSAIDPMDARNMNRLYAKELSRLGKTAAGEKDIQAFKDHEEFEKTLESILSEDKNTKVDVNNPLMD